MIGRYPDYDVLESSGAWDEATRKVVLARLDPSGPLRFFTAGEEPTLRAFCDTVMAQDAEPRVPVAEAVDDKLAAGRLDGYQYAGMPDDRDTWRLVLRGLDHTTHQAYRRAFAECTAEQRENVVDEFAQGRLVGGPWDEMHVRRAWSVVMRGVLAAFYSHPWAWNEIGFGGPAYPRGYMRLGGPRDGRGRRARAVRATGADRRIRCGGTAMGDVLRGVPQGRRRSPRQRLPAPARRRTAGTCRARRRCATTPTATRSTW